MALLSLVASAAFPTGNLHQEHQGFFKPRKEFRSLPLNGKIRDASWSSSIHFSAQQIDDLWRQMHLLLENRKSGQLSPVIGKSMLIDVQGPLPDSVLFSNAIAEKCLRNEKILKFLMSGSKFAEGQDLDVSLLSEVMGFHNVTIDMSPLSQVSTDDNHSVYEAEMDDTQNPIYIPNQIYVPQLKLTLIGNSSDTSYFIEHPYEKLLFAQIAVQMDNLEQMISEFSLSKRTIIGSKQSLLVPYFTSKGRRRTQAQKQVYSSSTIGPPKSHCDTNPKTFPKKKKNKKTGRERSERDLYRRNYFHACESLLTVILDQGENKSILALKKSGTEICQLLAQISAAIAGVGLAVIFSVMCRLACGKGTLTAKLSNTGLGLGLFWLSSAINGLRDTFAYVSRNSGKLNLDEEETYSRLERGMNEVVFRATALVVVAVLCI